MKKKSLEKTAYHEAGHAVMTHSLGRRFRYVTVIPNDDYLGCVRPSAVRNFHPEWDSSRRGVRLIEGEIMIFFAGQIAEKMFSECDNWTGSRGDWSGAVDVALYLAADSEIMEAYLNLFWAKAKVTMRRPWIWHAVKALSKELLTAKKIPYLKAKEIIDRALDDWHKQRDYSDPATWDPDEVLAYRIDPSTLVCCKCIGMVSGPVKNKDILTRRAMKDREFHCCRCGNKILKSESGLPPGPGLRHSI